MEPHIKTRQLKLPCPIQRQSVGGHTTQNNHNGNLKRSLSHRRRDRGTGEVLKHVLHLISEADF